MNDADATALTQWLDQEFRGHGAIRGWQVEELGKALETIAEDTRKKGQKQYAPTGPEIKTAIIRGRYKSTEGQVGPKPEDCGLCAAGWIDYYPELPDAPASLNDFGMAYALSVPCRCPAGEHALRTAHKKTSAAALDRIAGMTKIAVRQNQQRLRLATVVGERHQARIGQVQELVNRVGRVAT